MATIRQGWALFNRKKSYDTARREHMTGLSRNTRLKELGINCDEDTFRLEIEPAYRPKTAA
jgi:hypothetical protein